MENGNDGMNIDTAFLRYRRHRGTLWDRAASAKGKSSPFSRAYHRLLQGYYRFLVPPGSRILELGCGRGDLLAALRPSFGLGIDFSREIIRCARQAHPELYLIQADVHQPPVSDTFDFIILSDLINDLWDLQGLLEHIRPLCRKETRVILNFHSHLWRLPLSLARRMGASATPPEPNWFSPNDVLNLLRLADMEVIRRFPSILLPTETPVLSPIANRFFARIFPFSLLSLSHILVARFQPSPASTDMPSVSVIVPARNEAGHIHDIIRRTPDMGRSTELIFVEGHSSDDTAAVIQSAIPEHPDRTIRFFQQTGKGKGDAVRLGFSTATGDILMILDADMTVPPEDLPRFYQALVTGKGEFVNGVRLVYPMEKESMRFLNMVGNKFFSMAFSWLLDQPVKDTLCGTKVLWRNQYERIAEGRRYFGDFDPFGDFDLIFGAAKLNLKIIDLPIRYRSRSYGDTNIQRWRHGWMLLKMVLFAARRIKFI